MSEAQHFNNRQNHDYNRKHKCFNKRDIQLVVELNVYQARQGNTYHQHIYKHNCNETVPVHQITISFGSTPMCTKKAKVVEAGV